MNYHRVNRTRAAVIAEPGPSGDRTQVLGRGAAGGARAALGQEHRSGLAAADEAGSRCAVPVLISAEAVSGFAPVAGGGGANAGANRMAVFLVCLESRSLSL